VSVCPFECFISENIKRIFIKCYIGRSTPKVVGRIPFGPIFVQYTFYLLYIKLKFNFINSELAKSVCGMNIYNLYLKHFVCIYKKYNANTEHGCLLGCSAM
jgi:hypothetical protein